MIEHLLDDCRVLDLSRKIAGAYCARLLTSMGAQTTKVEPPGGDPMRAGGPFPEDRPHPEKGGLFIFLNAGKRSITLDFANATGRAILLDLAKRAEVIVEDGDPGALASLALGFEVLREVNPRLVLCSVTPFGQDGPYRDYRATELVELSMGGLVFTTGEPGQEPLASRGPQASLIGGLTAAVATLTATSFADLTGEGQHVDVSIFESLVSILEVSTTVYEYSGLVRQRTGPGRGSHYAAILPAKNGDVGVNTTTPVNWENMCLLMDMPELLLDPRFTTAPLRAQHAEEITAIIKPWLAEHTKEEVYEKAQRMHIPFGLVRTAKDVFEAAQYAERGFFVEVDVPLLGRVKVPSLPFRVAGEGAAPLGAVPALGEHNAAVYGELGLSAENLVVLRRAGII